MTCNNTLQDVFLQLVSNDDRGVSYINGINEELFIPYSELYENAGLILGSLQAKGIKEKDELIFQFSGTREFIETFWACILGGIIPIPISFGGKKEIKDKLHNILALLDSPFIITTRDNLTILLSGFELQDDEINDKIIIFEDLSLNKFGNIKQVGENDIAYIQFSSGSTGNPKGVILSHKNLLANIRSIHAGINSPSDGDRFLSWMPLTHDMGLIGFHLTPILKQWNHFIIPTELFIRNPSLWLKKVSQHKITFTSSPNFGYKHLLKHFRLEQDEDIDLSSLRIIVNGAEPISVNLCKEFVSYFSRYGIGKHVIFPVYGLAEASLAVSFSDVETDIISVHLDRNKLGLGDQICEIDSIEDGASFVNVGRPVENTCMRIANRNGEEFGANYVGSIQIKGDNVTSGYYKNESASAEIINGGWLDTGDLGYVNEKGELYITGRAKDIIFVNGQNYYPHDLERIAEAQPYIELGKIAIGGIFSELLHRDQIIVFILFRGKIEKFLKISEECKIIINDKAGIIVDVIIPVKVIPKSTSGKVQRFKLLDEYKKGQFADVEQEMKELSDKCTDKNVELPNNEIEEKILLIWKNVLNGENIGVGDNFFEIGGNSLNAGYMAMRVKDELGIEISLKDLFVHKNIKSLAKLKRESKDEVSISVEIVKEREFYNLSKAQKRLFYQYHIDKDSVAYNLPQVFIIDGSLNINKFENALKLLIGRHDVLRTSFLMKNNEPIQKVHQDVFVELEEITISDNENINSILKKHVTPFVLEVHPLLRVKYCTLEEGKYLLLIDIHHLVADGSSVVLLIDELFKILREEDLNSCKIQYKEYLHWEKRFSETENYLNQEKFWLKQFNDEIHVLELPLDFPRISTISYEGSKIRKVLGQDSSNRVAESANRYGVSKQMLMFAAYSLLLNKYSGQEDIVIGVPEAGRNHLEFLGISGMFVNNLAIRCFPTGCKKFSDYIQEIKDLFIEVLENKNYPFDSLVEKLDIAKGTGRNPLFDTMFIYQNIDLPQLMLNGQPVEHYQLDHGISRFDISFEIMEKDNMLEYYIEYSSNLFSKQTIEKLAIHFERILECVVSHPDRTISDIDLFTDEEKTYFISDYNNTRTEYPREKLIHELFEDQVKKTPIEPAVIVGDNQISYQELDEKANQLVWVLLEKDIKPNDLVAIMAERSEEVIVSILAVLKTGAAYVPIDILYPLARKKFIIEDSNPQIILTTNKECEENAEVFNEFPVDKIIHIDDDLSSRNGLAENKVIAKPENIAYVIYTSGTTGLPKGVMIEHRNLVDYISWAGKNYVKGEKVNFPFFTSIAFDLTVTSIFTPLTTGNAIVVYPEIDNEIYIHKVLRDDASGVIKLTPSHLKLIRDDRGLDFTAIKNLKRFIVGGEDLESQLAQDIYEMFNGNVEIFNEYGPTEATVGCMIYKYNPEIDKGKSVPIGVPASNAGIYLLDKYQKLVAPGVYGEMYISGDGVAKGYLNREELTQERFVEIPEVCNGKLYRTGDIARFLPDGNIIFGGRIDNQININGFRVELGEIETKLVQYEGIEKAIIAVREDKPNVKSICAYFTADAEINIDKLKEFISRELPFYMIPSSYTKLDVIPLTANGKIDVNSLPIPEINYNSENYMSASNEMQELLVLVYQDVLNIEKVGITDNFFELGGDSIKAVQITSRLYDKGLSLNVKDILTHQTISQVSLYTELSDKQYEQGVISGEKGLTPIESWFLELQLKNTNHYNQSVMLNFNKEIDKKRLELVFNKLIEYHDGLRLNYNEKARGLFINNEFLKHPFKIEEFEINDETNLEQIGEKLKSGFSIASSILLQAAIIKEKEKVDKLLITAHHLVIDGISWRILLEDLYNLYRTSGIYELPKKTASILDWQVELEKYSESDEISKQVNYWGALEETEVNLFDPIQVSHNSVGEIGNILFDIDTETTEYLLKDANLSFNTDVQILLLTAFLNSLRNLSDNNTFQIEMENHGRHLDDVDVSRTIGWFTAMYPMQFEMNTDDIEQQIKYVKEQIRNVPSNGLGYGLLKYFRNEWGEFKDKNYQIRFNYLGRFDNEISNDLFFYSNEYSGRDISDSSKSITGIEINSMVVNGKLNIEIKYNRGLVENHVVKSMKDRFLNNIHSMISFLKDEDDIHFTPSDFEEAGLDQEDLNVLFE